VPADGRWHFDSGSGAQEILARQIGEDETLATRVCQAIGKTNLPGANAAAADDAVIDFAQNLAKSEAANAPTEVFHGYYFRKLRAQSADLVVVAYPANYRASGVMTFIATRGAVYERDLGPQTTLVAQNINGSSVKKWNRVQ
jgi:hypothetical protein